MDVSIRIKLAVYRHFAVTGRRPEASEIADRTGETRARVVEAFRDLRAQRLLALDGEEIRMAPPFSGVPTQHEVEVGDVRYFANCAWDAFGIPAALHREGVVYSRCEQSGETLRMTLGRDGPAPSTWLFHCLVPAAQWWDDIVFT